MSNSRGISVCAMVTPLQAALIAIGIVPEARINHVNAQKRKDEKQQRINDAYKMASRELARNPVEKNIVEYQRLRKLVSEDLKRRF